MFLSLKWVGICELGLGLVKIEILSVWICGVREREKGKKEMVGCGALIEEGSEWKTREVELNSSLGLKIMTTMGEGFLS